MRGAAAQAHAAAMATEASGDRCRIEVIFTADAVPVTGHITTPTGEDTTFTGWLELIQILEEARTRSEPEK